MIKMKENQRKRTGICVCLEIFKLIADLTSLVDALIVLGRRDLSQRLTPNYDWFN